MWYEEQNRNGPIHVIPQTKQVCSEFASMDRHYPIPQTNTYKKIIIFTPDVSANRNISNNHWKSKEMLKQPKENPELRDFSIWDV